MKFVNIETGKKYTLEEEREDGFVLSDKTTLYLVKKDAFLYWYTTEEIWNLHQNYIKYQIKKTA